MRIVRLFPDCPCMKMAIGYHRTIVIGMVAASPSRLPRCVSRVRPRQLAFSSSAWHCVVLNPEPVHQTAKCVWMDVKDGSRAIGSADHPAGSLENSQNMPALYIVK